MRTFRGNAPIIIGAGALVLALLAPASPPLRAEEGASLAATQATAALPEAPAAPESQATLAELRAKLDESDRAVALKALDLALTELGDGTTLLWKRPTRHLAGAIKPVSVFRDGQGRVCRHVIYGLTLGSYAKQVEGIACRDADGHWSLEG